MKIDYKLHEVAGSYDGKFNYVQVNPNYLQATDGIIAVRIPMTEGLRQALGYIPEKGYYVHKRDWRLLIQAKARTWINQSFMRLIRERTADSIIEVTHSQPERERTEGLLSTIFEEAEDLTELEPTMQPYPKFDAALLSRVQKGLGSEGVVLYPAAERHMLYARPSRYDGLAPDTKEALAIISPMM